VAIANALQLEAARATSVLSRVNYDIMPSLQSPNHYITLRCDIDRWHCDLDLWPLNVNLCSISPVTWWNIVSNLSAIEQSVAELLRFQNLTLWPWTYLSVACGSGIMFTNFGFWQLIIAHVVSRCDLAVWSLDLKLLQHFGCFLFTLCTKFQYDGCSFSETKVVITQPCDEISHRTMVWKYISTFLKEHRHYNRSRK